MSLLSAIPVGVLAGFLLVLLIVKLALADYSIEVSTVSRALIGVLVAAKVVLIFDRMPISRYISFDSTVTGFATLLNMLEVVCFSQPGPLRNSGKRTRGVASSGRPADIAKSARPTKASSAGRG